MTDLQNFEQISIKPGFMKHNGGLHFERYQKKSMNLKPQLMKII